MLKWFSISGIRKEIKRIRWPKAKELFSNSLVAGGFLSVVGL